MGAFRKNKTLFATAFLSESHSKSITTQYFVFIIFLTCFLLFAGLHSHKIRSHIAMFLLPSAPPAWRKSFGGSVRFHGIARNLFVWSVSIVDSS